MTKCGAWPREKDSVPWTNPSFELLHSSSSLRPLRISCRCSYAFLPKTPRRKMLWPYYEAKSHLTLSSVSVEVSTTYRDRLQLLQSGRRCELIPSIPICWHGCMPLGVCTKFLRCSNSTKVAIWAGTTTRPRSRKSQGGPASTMMKGRRAQPLRLRVLILLENTMRFHSLRLLSPIAKCIRISVRQWRSCTTRRWKISQRIGWNSSWSWPTSRIKSTSIRSFA